MQRILSIVLAICLVLSLSVFPVAAEEKQHDYSTCANSGIRHETCTTLLGTSAESYYTGVYTYDTLSGYSGDALLVQLRQLMATTHTKKTTYNDCRDLAVKTDCENGDGITISLLYTSYVATWDDWCNNRTNGWNREHLWALSLGSFTKNQAPGCDLHHVRPSDQLINNTRGSLKYGNVENGKEAKSASYIDQIGGYCNSTYFEPLDNVKGDIARICLYVYVRYGGEYSKCGSITNVFESVDVLLQWCALDPVDTWEMGRNEVVGAIQGNRNVFIDYPELAWLLFDQYIPTDMQTPSGEAANSTPPPCSHPSSTVKNAKDATCADAGYTGDTYCADCGELLETGRSIPATGQHRFGNWVITLEPTIEATGIQERVCTVCGHTETSQIPQLEKPVEPDTEPTEPDQEPTEPDPEPSEPDPEPSEPDPEPSEPDPVPSEPDPVPSEPDPVPSEPDPEPSEPGPEPSEPDPVPSEPDPEPSEPNPEPSEPDPEPSEPEAEPSEPGAEPTQPDTKPSELDTEATEPMMEPDENSNYRWLVYVVISFGAVVCVVVILIQNKRSK